MAKPFFITEKETEEWLSMETRTIPMPGGQRQPYTQMKLLWTAYDFIIENQVFDGAQLAELALADGKATGHSFAQSFPNTIAYVNLQFRRALAKANLPEGGAAPL